MDMVEGRILWDRALPGMTSRPSAARSTTQDRHARRAAQHRLRRDRAEEYRQAGQLYRRQVERWTKQYTASETEHIPEVERLIEWLPQHPARADADRDRPRRLPPRQHDLPRHRAARARGARLGAVDARRSAGRLHLLPDELGDRPEGVGRDGTDGRHGIPTIEESVARYCAATGRDGVPDLNWYFAYNIFRLAGIVQGIKKRMIDGNASSAQAARTVGSACPGWWRRRGSLRQKQAAKSAPG